MGNLRINAVVDATGSNGDKEVKSTVFGTICFSSKRKSFLAWSQHGGTFFFEGTVIDSLLAHAASSVVAES